MLRRLYYLFPDVDQVKPVIGELVTLNVPKHRMHVMARKDIDIHSLPGASKRQRSGTMHHIVTLGWNINLLLFFIAMLALFIALFSMSWLVVAAAIVVMTATFVGGYLYVTHLPDIDLSAFNNALAHGEVLLMVDVPLREVVAIESYMHHRHFEAYDGGVSWTVDAFGL